MRTWRPRALTICMTMFLFIGLAASGAQAQTKRILIVGDSWAAQSWASGAFQAALDNSGLSQFAVHGGPTTIGGSTAAQWATAPYLEFITQELVANPTLDIVHLWMGGNDFLGCGGCDPVALVNQIASDVQTVVDHVLSVRADARIAYAGYDYIPGVPTGIETLAMTTMIAQATTTGTFWVLDLYGVLDHVYGFPPNFGPGERSLPGGYPSYMPLLGGEPTLGSDPILFADAIHPTTASYTTLVQHGVDEFYTGWLMAPQPVPALELPGTLILVLLMAGVGRSVASSST